MEIIPSNRKFYRTVFQVEVLSEEPYENNNLDTLYYDITEGHCSGKVTKIVHNEEKTGPEIAKLLEAQSSEPEFFQLTPEGEDIAEEDFSGEPVMICDQCKKKFNGPTDFSGDYYDCWDLDGHPTYHYDCCSHECWERYMSEVEYCDKCGRNHPLQENAAHGPRGSSMIDIDENGNQICRRCAEELERNNKND
jgi:hypothetical protein